MPNTPCPGFELAPLERFPKESLLAGRNTADAFVLVLATAFNDLKGQMWVIEQLNKCRPEALHAEPYTGQWQGMQVQCKRYIAAILHELLEAVASASNAGILDDATFQKAVRHSGEGSQRAWTDLVAVAMETSGDSELRKVLNSARNRAAFHYDRTRLWDGYRDHFVNRPADEYNEAAFASLGETMEQSRFFFADAAADRALGFYDVDPDLFARLNTHIRGMNQALRNLVEQYLIARG